MRTIRIIHSSDLRLDSPYEALDTSRASVRREEQAVMLDRLVTLANDERADLMLLCGNLAETQSTAENLISRLEKVSCPVFLAPSHAEVIWSGIRLPENISILFSGGIRSIPVPSADARLWYVPEGSLRGFHAERHPDTYNIVCMNSPRESVTEEDVAASGTDYIAFGRDSTSSGLLRSGSTWYSWPGCPEGRGFDECGEKTVNVIELAAAGCRLRRENIALRQYRRMTLDISEKDPLLMIHTSLPDDTVGNSYRIVLTGESLTAPDLHRLHQNLEEMFFSLQLVDRTRIPADIWEIAGDDTLKGLFLKKLRVRYDAASSESQRIRIEQSLRWGLAALEDGEEVAVHENP